MTAKKEQLIEDVQKLVVKKIPKAKPKFQAAKGVEAYSFMPVKFADVHAKVFGGPFAEYVPGQRRLVSVKMAVEVDHPHDISIPTKDFSVPDERVLHEGIHKALKAILAGNDLYVGCWGGIGRTGLFMACLAKVMFEFEDANDLSGGDGSTYDPVAYVRQHYFAKAVETDEQKKFVADFQTSQHVIYLNRMLHMIPAQPRVIVREVPVYYFNPFRAFKAWLDKR